MTRVPTAEPALRRDEHADGRVVYRSPALDELGVPHLFTTRIGTGGRDLDAGALDREQELWLARAAGAEAARLARVRQVHGCAVRRVEGDEPEPLLEADALVTERADRLLVVRVADCVPVLVATSDGRRVAAIHAGWRGLVAGVIPRALEALAVLGADARSASRESRREFASDSLQGRALDATRVAIVASIDCGEIASSRGSPIGVSRPEPPRSLGESLEGSARGLVAAIGPCLSLARFEVGPEVARAFEDAGFAEVVHVGRGRSGRPHVDLRAAARLALRRGGATRIDDTDRCTYEHEHELFSYRRDVTHRGAALSGRLGALIAPKRG